MDKTQLVTDIQEAWRAVSALDKAGLPVLAATAVESHFPGGIRIFIASPDVERYGPTAVIQFVDTVLRELKSPFKINDTYIVNQKDEIAKQVKEYFGDRTKSYHYGSHGETAKTISIFSQEKIREDIILFYNPRARASRKRPEPDQDALLKAKAA